MARDKQQAGADRYANEMSKTPRWREPEKRTETLLRFEGPELEKHLKSMDKLLNTKIETRLAYIPRTTTPPPAGSEASIKSKSPYNPNTSAPQYSRNRPNPLKG